MPRPTKSGIEANNMSMTSFLETVPIEMLGISRGQAEMWMEADSEELTLGLLKDILLREMAKISTDLKDIKADFKRVDM